jgi:hypothetical protein
MNNIVENNKIIAEFLVKNEGGLVKLKENIFSTIDGFEIPDDYLTLKDLKYHKDWNWLMEVVEKIENLQDENNCAIYNVQIEQSFTEIIDNHTYETIIYNIDADSKIEAVYDSCIEFIKWYNEKK